MSGSCIRCGREGEVEYGTDGQAYCSSCSFYGMNKQCSHCRMYLPASELQQYRGQLICPYCIQDLQAEDRRANEYHEERSKMEVLQIPEVCERCGRSLDGRVYIWNGKKLCHNCVSDEQAKWGVVGGGPMTSPLKVSMEPENRRRKVSFMEAAISDVLHILGIMKKPKTIEIVEYHTRFPIQNAKPMAENKPMAEREKSKPVTEGLMKLENAPKNATEKVRAKEKNESFFEQVKAKPKRKSAADENPFSGFSPGRKKKR
jgi:hypothetical protein